MQSLANISDYQEIVFGDSENGCLWHFQNTDNQYRYSHKITPNSTGKELDAETGFSYFGARYLDHTLTTAWLSVDPMSDKYPSISPYAYCAWNPLKLVDPKGKEIDLSGFLDQNGNVRKGRELAYKAFLFFAKTKYGQKTLALYAKKDQVIAGHKYEKNGEYHNKGIDLSFSVGNLNNGHYASGETTMAISKHNGSNRIKLTIALCNPVQGSVYDVTADYLQTICHEMYFHVFNFSKDYIDDGIINDSEIRTDIKKKYNYRNTWHEIQDLRYNHAYRDNAIPIMTEFFQGKKNREETIEWMSKQGINFQYCNSWYIK